MLKRKLHDFEITRVAAAAICNHKTVRAYLTNPDRMRPATRARVEAALLTLGYLGDAPTLGGNANRTIPEDTPEDTEDEDGDDDWA